MPAQNRQVPEMLRFSERAFFRDPRLPVVVTRMVRQNAMGPHQHEFLELVLILGGSGIHVTEAFRHEVCAGDVFVINPSRSHGYAEPRRLKLVNVMIREETLLETAAAFASLPGYHALFTLEPVQWRQKTFESRMRLSPAKRLQLEQWIAAMEAETRRADTGGGPLAKAWLFLILGELAREYGDATGSTAALSMRLSRVLSWMEAHYAQPVELAELAAMAHLSERSLLRHFQAALGESPKRYLNRLRLQKARQWLDQPRQEWTVTEIASRCGFEDPNYFTRLFRREFGYPPSRDRSCEEFRSVVPRSALNSPRATALDSQ